VADPALRRALRRQFWPYDHPRLYGLREGALAAARRGKRTIATALRRLGVLRAEEMELMP
jgi:ABC-type phosphonate transport system ATPase subunit